MSKHDDEIGARTYDEVRRKFRDWHDTRPPAKPRRRYSPSKPLLSPGISRALLTAIGAGIGVILLVLAALSIWRASMWGTIDRGGGAVGWGLVGFFLIVAGLSAIFATWNHNYRTPARPAPHH